jgi:hypothetical protein
MTYLMTRPIRLFVSSSPDLAPEREALGQAVAEMPISAGWEIRQTLRPNEDVQGSLDFIRRCDLFILILGADFAAPMGLEWQAVRGTGKPVLAYRKRVLRSPSAQQMLREARLAWGEIESAQELKAQVIRNLAQTLLDGSERFGLDLGDVEGLLGLVQVEEVVVPAEPDRRRGAGRGGVILDRRT